MKTNRFFSFKRFGLLLSSDFRLNGKRYLFSLATGVVILYLILLIGMTITSSNFTARDYSKIFFVCAFALCAFEGSVFPEFGNRIKTGNYLLLPASALEKIVSQFLIYIVLGTLFFLLIFGIDTYLARWSALQMEFVLRSGITIEKFHYSMLSRITDNPDSYMMIISTGLFLFTSRLLFRRYASIKSIILLIALILLLRCGMTLLSHIFYPDETVGFDITLPQYELASGLYNIQLYWNILIYSTWVFFLPFAYYKLKEKQV